MPRRVLPQNTYKIMCHPQQGRDLGTPELKRSIHIPLSSAEAPVSKHQWKKNTGAGALERENGSVGNDGKRKKAFTPPPPLRFNFPSSQLRRAARFFPSWNVGGLCGGEISYSVTGDTFSRTRCNIANARKLQGISSDLNYLYREIMNGSLTNGEKKKTWFV